jgi:hypothetical protein
MTADVAILLTGRVLRAFGFGFSPVLPGLLLERRGLSSCVIGLALTVGQWPPPSPAWSRPPASAAGGRSMKPPASLVDSRAINMV